MADSGSTSTENGGGGTVDDDTTDAEPPTTEELRQRVEEEYDFENFGPEDMARMSREEWEAVFDPETWITGTELLDRVEADLRSRVANRNVFARIERFSDPERLVAYSERGYAVVYGDGSVGGEGTVRRDVDPSVALCSMEEYEVPDPPEDAGLPAPEEVPQGSGELGNVMLQAVALVQVLAGLALLGGWVVAGLGLVSVVAGLAFLVIGGFLLLVVANARLSDRFRAEEYRTRLRSVGVGEGERPEFLPPAATPGPVTPDGSGEDTAVGSVPDGDDGDETEGEHSNPGGTDEPNAEDGASEHTESGD